MSRVIVLDTGPLGLATQRRGVPLAEAFRRWTAAIAGAGHRIIVPEIADYEIRREPLRANKAAGLGRLDAFNAAEPDRFLPLDTPSMRLAASLWASIRNQGHTTAGDAALDGDVILAAQVLTCAVAPADLVVATTNVKHIARVVAADLWTNIQP
jgi:predicted nucleic acid-binding protein